ncbi:hypothetical protein GDO86_015150 [Hymenochirus boettgeri]|uniref:LEM domain-containing protein n=1 Tax=Hymenochirus boettgeri TaxID=247094 RepID=A0A8T2JWB5_9PIPI|nr:hypothetical protein GDO86_015150 [Hymenochirus boettgeri]
MDRYKRMTDEELIESLRNCNITHGPVVDSYETKTHYRSGPYENDDDSYETRTRYRSAPYDDDDSDSYYEEKTVTRTYHYPPAPQRSHLESFEHRSFYGDNTYQPVSQMRHSLGSTQNVEPRKPIREIQKEETSVKRYIPLWLHILLLLLLTGFLAYIYFSEESNENPFRKHISE